MGIFIEIVKGIIIGIANVIPGLSGGTIAVSMGIYEKLIYAVNNIFKTPLKCLKDLWTYILGIAIGIIIAVFGITYLFTIAPIPTAMLFVGMILGAVPTINTKLDNKRVEAPDIIAFVVFLGIIVAIPFIQGTTIDITSVDFMTYIILGLLGLVSAAAMVIPGVSGSMLLMAFGYYEYIMSTISEFIKAVTNFNFDVMFDKFFILLPFGIGVLIGIIVIAKLIAYLLKHYHKTVYWGIMGLLVASPFPIIIGLDMSGINIIEIVIAILACVIGAYSTIMLTKPEEKRKKNVKKS